MPTFVGSIKNRTSTIAENFSESQNFVKRSNFYKTEHIS